MSLAPVRGRIAKKRMEYKIIQSVHEDPLMDLVSEAIDEGWRPQGGVSVVAFSAQYDGMGFNFYQAMVREV